MQKSIVSLIVVLSCALTACNKQEKVEIKPAPKLTNDATFYAKHAWALMNEAEPMVKDGKSEQLRKSIRELTTDWRINVKMTDSVTEGKYAMCRKALTDLDTWARTQQKNDYNIYLTDKDQCKDAIDHPELGNTSPN